MNKKEAKGSISWVDEEVAGYRCECGEEITVSTCTSLDTIEDCNECPRCGRRYVLQQINIVYEIEKDAKNLAK